MEEVVLIQMKIIPTLDQIMEVIQMNPLLILTIQFLIFLKAKMGIIQMTKVQIVKKKQQKQLAKIKIIKDKMIHKQLQLLFLL